MNLLRRKFFQITFQSISLNLCRPVSLLRSSRQRATATCTRESTRGSDPSTAYLVGSTSDRKHIYSKHVFLSCKKIRKLSDL